MRNVKNVPEVFIYGESKIMKEQTGKLIVSTL